eukprot:TRINITY_DN45684_c0_g1_i1.p1 TRINITY_DN45684_c0_g1~~TRINITY_DN45684_c0_g1_i1.p1  ORF type:complete len:306 (-),score=27.23 TRINITY_DN45684_c0_g1_i1:367-1284(-)
MAAIEEDSFRVMSLGRQHDSMKPSMPAYSIGTAQRDVARQKVYVSADHEVRKGIMNSPGPVYSVPSTVGVAPKYGFGSDEQRKHDKAKYPDSSVDLACAVVDSQKVKFPSTTGVHFGTETRMCTANAEIIRCHPGLALGVGSPGALEYMVDDKNISKVPPQYSFGPKTTKIVENKPVTRLALPLTGVPRHVGPGSHDRAGSMGAQPQSARPSAPSFSFGGEERLSARKDKQLLDSSTDFSSLGRQVVSSARSAPRHGFGTSTRDNVARTNLVLNDIDKGPAHALGKNKFHCDIPPPTKHIPRPGM